MHKAELRKLICAMLLGDGYMSERTFQLHHSMKQVDYAKWKIQLLDDLFKSKDVVKKIYWKEDIPQYNKKTDKTYYSCRYQLHWPKYFRIFRNWVYRADKTKKIEFLLKHMETDQQLAIWFLDDGSEESHLNSHKDGSKYRTNPRLILHICDYTHGDAKLAQQWFQRKYNVNPRIIATSKVQGNRPRLRFTTKDAKVIFDKICPYVLQTETGRTKFSLCLDRYHYLRKAENARYSNWLISDSPKCPQCDSDTVSKGSRGPNKRFKCKSCNVNFTIKPNE